jgi:hypothetical protein
MHYCTAAATCYSEAALQAHYCTAAASATAKQLCKRIIAPPLHLPHCKAALQAHYCTAAASATAKQLCKRIFCTATATCYSEAALQAHFLHSHCICHCEAALQAHYFTATASATAKQLCKCIIAPPLHLPLQSSSASVSFHCLCNLLQRSSSASVSFHCLCNLLQRSSSATLLTIRHGSASTAPYIIHHHRIR